MRIVIALGGNAILQRGEALDEDIQKKNIANACKVISKVAEKHQVIVTHGNGPQVGLLALQNDAYKQVPPYTLDVLGAETEGMIGYLMMQELKNNTKDKNVLTILTQTLVDPNDAAFKNPTKFVGPIYTEQESKTLSDFKDWDMCQDGEFFRRVVPSPEPKQIVEEESIKKLLDIKDLILICVGGGGIPVKYDNNKLVGVEAVVDKDKASNVLAQAINADIFIMLTDVDSVETNFKQKDSKKIKLCSPEQLNKFNFAEGSMGPKISAACSFVKAGGEFSGIGSLTDLEEIISGNKGTRVHSNHENMEFY